jgi:hypothetical protein
MGEKSGPVGRRGVVSPTDGGTAVGSTYVRTTGRGRFPGRRGGGRFAGRGGRPFTFGTMDASNTLTAGFVTGSFLLAWARRDGGIAFSGRCKGGVALRGPGVTTGRCADFLLVARLLTSSLPRNTHVPGPCQ